MESSAIELSGHAREQAALRGIDEATVVRVAAAPDQRERTHSDREVRQSLLRMGDEARLYLIRVVVELRPLRQTIISVYRTSKIRKYWRPT